MSNATTVLHGKFAANKDKEIVIMAYHISHYVFAAIKTRMGKIEEIEAVQKSVMLMA